MHLVELPYIPGTDDYTPRVRIILQSLHHFGNLVDMSAVVIGPRAPLVSVNRAKLTVGTGPLVPDTHSMLLQIMHIGVATQKPQQFVYNRLQMKFFGSKQRKTLFKVETHLIAEYTACAGTGAVALFNAVGHHMVKKFEILFHQILYSEHFSCP